MSANLSSSQLREQGNSLYKDGRLLEAIESYAKAAQTDPEDPAPLGNLSAAYHEIGQYEKSVEASRRAMAFSHGDDSRKEKLLLRQARCHVYIKELSQAQVCFDALSTPEALARKDCLSQNKSRLEAEVSDPRKARRNIVNGLPRYKVALLGATEFYPVGHDRARSLFESSMAKGDTVAYLFGGIGDARHLFATLIDIADNEAKGRSKPTKHHFSVVDVSVPMIARDLIIFLLLDKLATLDSSNSQEKLEVLATIFYLYVAVIMPQVCFERLQETVESAIVSLESDLESLPSWLYIPLKDRTAVADVLKAWRRQAKPDYDTAFIRSQNSAQMLKFKLEGNGSPVKVSEKRAIQLGIVFPPKDLDEPELHKLVRAFETSSGGRKERAKLIKYVESHWKPNVTMIDEQWERITTERLRKKHVLWMGHNTLDFAEQCSGVTEVKSPSSLFDHAEAFFGDVANAVQLLKGQFKVEATVGEIGQTLEQIRYGLLDYRMTEENPARDNSEFPKRYERIHLSNIPDYIGGPLASFIWATPVTSPGPDAYITSCNLRNPGNFNSIEEFNNEYARINSAEDLEKIFQIRRGKIESDVPFLITSNYVDWHRSRDTPRSPDEILSRSQTETWLYGMFLSLALPIDRDPRDKLNFIVAPLNMTMFLRLLEHLHDTGYPSHWLSTILGDLLTGTIKSTARPTRTDPLEIGEVRQARSARKQSVAPFTAELSTLAAMWEPILPFGIADLYGLPSVRYIRRYTLGVPEHTYDSTRDGILVLCFVNQRLLDRPPINLRDLLIDDEEKIEGAAAADFREKGVHIVSCWKWSAGEARATFWLREDVVKSMKRSPGWVGGIWRTDTWQPQCIPVLVRTVVDTGMTWADYDVDGEEELWSDEE